MLGEGHLALMIQIAAGVCLAACCGLRAFVPPFVIGLAARTGVADMVLGQPLQLQPAFDWIGSTPALVIFGSAMIFELLADKIPAVDHVLDFVETGIRPVAGALVVAASMHELDPLPATVIGLILGGATAGTVHALKAKTRVLSTLATGGLATPLLSFAEDGIAIFGSVLAVTVAFVGLVALLMAVLAGIVLLRWFRRAPVPAPARVHH